jgi:hypothetical protein
MTFTHLDAEMCAQIADVCVTAGRPELISAYIREGIHPREVKRLLAKPAISAAPLETGLLSSTEPEAAAQARFTAQQSRQPRGAFCCAKTASGKCIAHTARHPIAKSANGKFGRYIAPRK